MTAFVEICLFLVCLQLGYYLLFTLSAANKALKSKKKGSGYPFIYRQVKILFQLPKVKCHGHY